VGTRDEWDRIVVRLRRAGDPYGDPAFAELWTLACEDGPAALESFRRSGKLDEARIADLTRDLVIGALPAILEAVNPHAYFVAAIVNAARSWLRRGSARVVSPGDRSAAHDETHPVAVAPDLESCIDASDFMLTLSERERSVLQALGHGEDRDAIARALGLTRANVDQIISRARRRFRREDEP
jgi:RNA polymerase sigma factor (sigma-70 family)